MDPCLACKAQANLATSDWEVIDFWLQVQDQVVNIFPMGSGDAIYLAPRREAWLATCEILGIRSEDRQELIAAAEELHELVHDRTKLPIAHLMDPEELREE